MYRIANLETRSLLTYRDGSIIAYGSEELAKQHAAVAQEMTNGNPHAVIHLCTPLQNHLARVIAPWFVKR